MVSLESIAFVSKKRGYHRTKLPSARAVGNRSRKKSGRDSKAPVRKCDALAFLTKLEEM